MKPHEMATRIKALLDYYVDVNTPYKDGCERIVVMEAEKVLQELESADATQLGSEANEPDAVCDNCKAELQAGHYLPLEEVEGLHLRLDPGGEVPAGECPACGALCYSKELSVNAEKILGGLEKFRHDHRNIHPDSKPFDWAVRTCEAIVAEVFGFKSRWDWFEKLPIDKRFDR